MRSRRKKIRHKWVSWRGVYIPLSGKELDIASLELEKDTNLVLCIQYTLIDSMMLHLNLSKYDAMDFILRSIHKIAKKYGTHQVKVINTPLVFYAKFTAHKNGKLRVDIGLNVKNIILSVEKLSSVIADATLLSQISSSN